MVEIDSHPKIEDKALPRGYLFQPWIHRRRYQSRQPVEERCAAPDVTLGLSSLQIEVERYLQSINIMDRHIKVGYLFTSNNIFEVIDNSTVFVDIV